MGFSCPTRSMEGSTKTPFNEPIQLELRYPEDFGHCSNKECPNFYESSAESYCGKSVNECASSKPRCAGCRRIFVEKLGQLCTSCAAKVKCQQCETLIDKSPENFYATAKGYYCPPCAQETGIHSTCRSCFKDKVIGVSSALCSSCEDEYPVTDLCFACEGHLPINVSGLCYTCSKKIQ